MRIALLEDDPDQATIMSHWLEDVDHRVEHCADAAAFLRTVRRDSFDLYLLDWMLPDLSGIEVLEKLRGEMNDFTPVVIATAKDEEKSIVRGLEAGADDYLVKPVRPAELIARVGAVLRRAGGAGAAGQDIDFAPYSISVSNKELRLDGQNIDLTNREFELALFLFRNAGKVVSRMHLLEAIWGIESKAVSTRTVDTHVSRLRKKLALGQQHGWALSAIYQHGYRMERLGTDSV